MRAAQPSLAAAHGTGGASSFCAGVMPLWVGRRNGTRLYRRDRLGSRDRRIARRYFEQGPGKREWISDADRWYFCAGVPALPQTGAAVVILAVVIVAGAVASLRI